MSPVAGPFRVAKMLLARQKVVARGRDRFWSVAGVAIIEIVVTLLTVKLLGPMRGMEQAVPEVD
jgi:hypothetical protein